MHAGILMNLRVQLIMLVLVLVHTVIKNIFFMAIQVPTRDRFVILFSVEEIIIVTVEETNDST